MERYHLKLSERLQNVADFLPKGARFADIGSDHAHLACYICLKDSSAQGIAGEVNQGPYESAVKNVKKHHLESQISVRLGDGLEVIHEEDEVNQVVIAGMGGGLITQILNESKEKLAAIDLLVLQPNVDARRVRIWLLANKFVLLDERILEENGHIYEILVAARSGTSPYHESILEKQLLFGPYLLHEKSPIFYDKWQEEAKKLERITGQMKEAKELETDKIKQFTKEINWMKEEVNND